MPDNSPAATHSPATEQLAATPAPMDEVETPADVGVPSPVGSFVNEVDSEMYPDRSQIAASHDSFMAFMHSHRQCHHQSVLQPLGSGVSQLTDTKVEPVKEAPAEDNALLAEAPQMATDMQADLQAVETRTQADDESLMNEIRNFGSVPSDAESSSLEDIFRGSQASSLQSRPRICIRVCNSDQRKLRGSARSPPRSTARWVVMWEAGMGKRCIQPASRAARASYWAEV